MSEKNNQNVRISGYVPEDVYEGIEEIRGEIAKSFPGARVTYGMALTELYRRYKELNEKKEV